MGSFIAWVRSKFKVQRADGTVINPATSEAQLPNNHSVTVSNPTANPETGLAKEATLSTRATEATLALVKGKTDNLDVALSTRATEATLVQIRDHLDTVETKLQTLVDQTDTLELNTNARPSQKAGRVHVRAHITNQTVTTVIHTVTAGKTFYLTSLILSVFNEAVGTVGQFTINDGADEKIPFILPPAVTGGTNPSIGTSPPIIEPIRFVTDVKFNMIAGTPRASITIVGYEEG